MADKKLHWEKVYNDKSPWEVSWYQKEPELSLRLIRSAGLAKEAPIIDVGGGASVLVDRLLAEGYRNLAVLDISSRALAFARERLGEQAGSVEWYQANITEFSPPHTFSLWHDRAVFHFLADPVERKNYVEVLKKTLSPQGRLILASFAIGGPTRCSGLDIVQYDAEKIHHELGNEFTLVETSDETHFTPANKEQRFSYFHFLRN